MSPEKLLLFLVMLSVLVVLHEYGHFLSLAVTVCGSTTSRSAWGRRC